MQISGRPTTSLCLLYPTSAFCSATKRVGTACRTRAEKSPFAFSPQFLSPISQLIGVSNRGYTACRDIQTETRRVKLKGSTPATVRSLETSAALIAPAALLALAREALSCCGPDLGSCWLPSSSGSSVATLDPPRCPDTTTCVSARRSRLGVSPTGRTRAPHAASTRTWLPEVGSSVRAVRPPSLARRPR